MAAAATAPEPNLVLAGRYRLEKRLGAGGMGAIWRAEHLVLRAPVAVKLLEREALPDEDTIARFMREAQAAATLRSPHVVQIFDYGVDGRWPFIVMELLEGENLAQRLKRVKRLSPENTMRILTHVARAMVRAHEAGIVHRDLKPENVFLIKNEDEEVAKVLDFGVAKVSSTNLAQPGQESARTRTGSILGTPYYMSPEQAQGNKTVDHRSDLWSLAVIAFECLVGTRPFFSDGLGDLVLQICVRDIPVPSDRATVPLGFDAWFAKAVARDPDLRFQTPREMIESLRDALGVESERTGSNPDILISSTYGGRDTQQDGEPRSERPPNSAIATVKQNGPGKPSESARGSSFQVVSSRGSQNAPDVNAATVVAIAPEKDEYSQPTLTEALFGTSSQRKPAPRRTALGAVFGVALVALGIGLVAGLIVLPRYSKLTFFGKSAAPLPAPLPPRSASQPRVKTPPSRVEAPPLPGIELGEGSTGVEGIEGIEEILSPPPSAAPSAGPIVPVPRGQKPQAPASAAAPPSSTPATAPTPWVKPEWARPDDEPIRKKGADDPYP